MSKKNVEPAHRVYRSRKDLFIDNLIGGIAWGLGGIIGASLVVALIGFAISQLETAPLIGSFVHDVIIEVEKYQ